MIRSIGVILLMTLCIWMNGQTILNMEILSNVQFGESGNDIWGFVDGDGTEYAVMGTRTATRIYSLEDPKNPIERYVVSGAAGTWRDIKYYEGFLYVTADQGSDGLTIIDVTDAPNNFSFTRWKPEIQAPNGTDTLRKAHNIYIDESTGFAYVSGHNVSNRGVLILDLKVDPNEPVVTAVIDEFYSHDAYVNNNKLFSSELGDGLAIYDVTDPANPIELTRQETSRDFCHNAWSTLDNNFVFTTDERSSAFLDAYDVSNDGEAILLDKYRPLETFDWPVIPHNTHILGNFAITSWYTDGVVITDISRPDNVIRVGQWDTYTNEENLNPNGAWFEGAWGAYPYLPSGLVLVSDINTGLYVFGAEYKSASWLEGSVTSKVPFELNKPISGAKVEILDTLLAFDETKTTGEYKTGAAIEGTFKVAVSHPNYISDTFEVEMVSGEVTILNVQLNASFLATSVMDANGDPIVGAKVVAENLESGEVFEYATNSDGEAFSAVKAGSNYNLYVASWGYLHQAQSNFEIIEGENISAFTLLSGYQDDFFADLGWQENSTANSGNWDRNPPVGTALGNEISNPDTDIDTDLGTFCWATGNQGSEAGDDDIDGGITQLTSPTIDMTDWESAKISYHYWFYNAGGNGTAPDDTLQIYITNGTESHLLDVVTTNTGGWTSTISHDVSPEDIQFTDKMTVVVEAGDYNEGHIVEAGFDGFGLINTTPSSTDQEVILQTTAFPNPSKDRMNIDFGRDISGQIEITNTVGKVVKRYTINGTDIKISLEDLPTGKYYGKIRSNLINETISIAKI